MRVGPEEVDLDGEVERRVEADTVAAEWMTMSQEASGVAAGVVEAEAVGADVAGDHL